MDSTPERWRQVEALLDEALELDPPDRAEWLLRACPEDRELRAEVESLLHASDRTGKFLEADPLSVAADLLASAGELPEGADRNGEQVGPWRLLRRLGQGGMGTVYLAERADGQFQQQVALKLIRQGVDSGEIVRRFLTERQILARLEHPNIARLVDGGATPEGQPWLAMEFVDGSSLTTWADDHSLSISQRLALFAKVCDAVRFAHQRLVVHRDLKPSNIVVDAGGNPKLLDFGIAKLLSDAGEEETLTGSGPWLLTPEYGTPEQIRGEPITTATDVYELGAVLYELLTGHRAHRLTRFTPLEIERAICETESQPPSSAVREPARRVYRDGRSEERAPEEEAAHRGTSPERLARALAGDLDTIILTCLRKDPARRYSSAEALLEDLRRYHAGRPIRARQDSTAYRVGKFIRRNRLAVGAAAALLVTLGAGVGATLWQSAQARQEAARARAVTDYLIGVFRSGTPEEAQGRTVTAAELLERGVRRVDSGLVGQPELQLALLDALGIIHRDLGLYEKADTLLERAVLLGRRRYGPQDTALATVLLHWGTALKFASQPDSAERALSEALRIRSGALGARHPLAAEALMELASVQHQLGKDSLAGAAYQRVITIDEARYGPDHTVVATDLNNLASMKLELGEPEIADSLLRRVVRVRRRELDSLHPLLLDALSNLAVARTDLEDYAGADSLLQEVLRKRRRVYSELHPELAWVYHTMAGVAEAQSNWVAAESLYRRAVLIRETALGPDHSLTVASLNNLATIEYRLVRYATADSLLRLVAERWGRTLGPDHSSTVMARHNLGAVLVEEDKLAEAERVLTPMLVARRKLRGPDHPEVAQSERVIGILDRKQGRLAESERVLRDALRISRLSYPEQHPRTADVLHALGETLLARNNAPAAEAALAEALTIREAKLPADDARTAATRRLLEQARQRPGARKPS